MLLIFVGEKEDQAPRQDGIEGSIEEGGLLNSFATDGDAGQILFECRGKSWRSFYRKDLKALFDQDGCDRKAGTTAEIEDAAARGECSGPGANLVYSNAARRAAVATAARKEVLRDGFVSAGSIHLQMVTRSTGNPAGSEMHLNAVRYVINTTQCGCLPLAREGFEMGGWMVS